MLKAGALYFAIVITFFIGVVSASLIMVAAYYRNSWLKEVRYDRMFNNLNSGINIALQQSGSRDTTITLDLFENNADSVSLTRRTWGVYDMAVISTYISSDTLSRVFMLGEITTEDPLAVYLCDEDRPVSVSGNTLISGDGDFPKSGLRSAYIDGQPYQRKELIYGKSDTSTRTMKAPDGKYLADIEMKLQKDIHRPLPYKGDEDVENSFMHPVKMVKLSSGKKISGTLSGNIIMYADTTITISSTATLKDIQIYAPKIVVESGFKGTCQLFATDSISIGDNSVFEYPSAAVILRTNAVPDQPTLAVGKNVKFNGVLFSYEKERTKLQTLVKLDAKTVVTGEIYSPLLQLEKGVEVKGKVSCNRFIMRTPTTLYENFLIDVTLDRKARSKYYLTAGLFGGNERRKVLKWLQ